MKNRIYILLIALIVGTTALYAESGTCGDNLTWTLEDGVLTISGYGEMEDYDVFHTTYQNSTSPWDRYKDDIKKVVLSNGITTIGYAAFFWCDSITSIEIPSSVTRIGIEAFSSCRNLTSIEIPNGVTSIGKWAFSDCNSLTSIMIPNSVTSIGDGAFSWCSNLTSITIPNSVTSIGERAFAGCGLTSVTIPNSVTSIGEKAFSNCYSLTSVMIPDNVFSIGKWAFSDCNSLTSINIPDRLTSINEGTFLGCSGLDSVVIPSRIELIERSAFENCGLTSITIPTSVRKIGPNAFLGCPLETITWNATNCIIDYEGGYDVYYLFGSKEKMVKSFTIGDEVIFIPNLCASTNSIMIPANVKHIGNVAFPWSNMTSINVSPNNYNYCSIDGVLFDKSKTTLIHYPGEKNSLYIIPNGVTSIGKWAFSDCNSLTSVTIPNSVTSIEEEAFNGCSSLTSVTLGNSVTSIGDYAFEGCSSLTSITIPNSVKSIGANIFYWCANLQEIHYPEGLDFYFSECPAKLIAYNPKEQPIKEGDVDYNIPETDVKNENTLVLIIANEHYKSVADVPFAINDGNVFKEYCIKTLGIDEDNILYIEDAGLGTIIDNIHYLADITNVYALTTHPHIIVYYAGHGIPDESSMTAYLLPVDASGPAAGYKLDQLYATLGKMPASQITVFMDACFSGSKRGNGTFASDRGERGVVLKAKSGVPQGKMVVFSAAQGDETAYPYGKQQHGLFTYYLLKKLQETKGNITLKQLGDYVSTQVQLQSIKINKRLQTPCVTASAEVAQEWQTWKLK